MLFSSLEFLYLFVPLTVLLYALAPRGWRNGVLFFTSLVFYGWGEPLYMFLMLATIAVDYAAGFLVERYRQQPKKCRAVLLGAIALNLASLFFFKYFNFFLDILRPLPLFGSLRVIEIALPIGISFYTFQSLSYVIDLYRGNARLQTNFISFGTYVTLFPQLIAGPIVRYHDVDEALRYRTHSATMVAGGIRTFACGLAKKVLLANPAGALFAAMQSTPVDERTTLGAWVGVIAFTLQIYFDFSGYSDMAIGLGKLFGFRFLENFHYPYVSRSITEFWRRWHISLSSWFREYVYIPLGGNRCGRGRMFFNLFVVWFLTGAWHGASWNYIVWGLYYLTLLIAEKLFLGRWLAKLPAVLSHAYTLFFVVIGWTIFAFEDSAAGLVYVKTMFGLAGVGLANGVDLYEIVRHLPLFLLSVVACLPVVRTAFWRLYEKHVLTAYVGGALAIGSLVLCTAYLVASGYNPFLYFRF